MKWIKLWLSKPDDERLGVSGQNITCIDYSNSTKYIKEIDWKGCELPVVKVNVTTISVREGNNFTILCNATGDPIPRYIFDRFMYRFVVDEIVPLTKFPYLTEASLGIRKS